MKKLLCLLLALAMALTALPAGVFAREEVQFLELGTSVEAPKLGSQTEDRTYEGPQLAPGRHALWFDRLGELPQYAADFYRWLVDNSDAGEALADPTVAGTYKDAYVYDLATVPGTVSYTYAAGEDPKTKAQEAVVEHCSDAFDVVMAYGVAVFSAFDRDRPEVFWLTGSTNYSWTLTYNYDYSGGSNVVDVYISYLRRKVDSGFDRKLIHTVWGVGWVLREES